MFYQVINVTYIAIFMEYIVRQTVKEKPLEMMLTTRQVADFLQVSVCTVRRWSDKGLLKFYRIGSRGDRRYRREDVLRFLDQPTTD